MRENEQLEIIGNNIRRLRLDSGLTSEELGKITGIGRTNIIRIEKGRANVTIRTLVVIAKFLNVKPIIFMG